ncbi:SPOR domain-containing protein [Treponema sp. OMZ 840]|uniref:SPOR domain-containing protein n=1 Tax=Treponema sp. OMZ 840 TaxID=244313 RepID=UPI003D8EFA12
MEEKRILWVSAAVGIFLLIVIGTAVFLYQPQKPLNSASGPIQAQNENTWILTPQAAGSVFTEAPKKETQAQPAENPISPVPPQPLIADTGTSTGAASVPLQSSDLTVISNNTTVYTKDTVTTIDITGASKFPEQRPIETPPGTEAAQDVKTVVPIETPAPKKPAVQAAPPKKPAAQTKKTAAKTPVQTKPVKPAAPADRYWVQAASFTHKDNAEHARSILADEKIPAEVFTHQDKSGKTYYRLRVGPYTTESEAEYWNSRIKLIDHFSTTQSYVTNSSKPLR